MSDLDLQRFNVGIDLALEAKELAESNGSGPIPGVLSDVTDEDGIKITRLDVTTEEGSRIMGKMIGHYVTFEVPELRKQDTGLQDRVATKLAQEFAAFLERIGIGKNANILIVGLGNWNVTPDALGPIVVENALVTRHFFELMPNEVAPGYRNVSAIAPGVLGITGIESSDIVQGIVDRARPDVIIAIDALASKALERVNTTIQIADTGIHPGSGIGNKRRGLTKEILGVPVIAIGVPTVLYASTIVSNSIDLLREHLKKHAGDKEGFMGLLDAIDENERLQLVREALGPLGHDLLVTPKEIDQFIEDIANIVASGLNAALHEAVDKSNVAAYTH
ncbi:GPR endopeptidase [Paenibacillus sacheonensis]|uniref:Germination protease n=1 Tax=Paenibacillus sacheonensis TaxID=742054 RepID=A0A7X5BWH9_9BACL|nr:GPR endopeptidase [Paenibacillus sacheonensis]MBM7565614.1 spore protease [Paenibacillus sacheonensis]NBC69468.1 GPR endopeptidase [Paenibacillus sacheonensis]